MTDKPTGNQAHTNDSFLRDILRKPLNYLLIFVPVALVVDFVLHGSPTLIFITAALGIIPLAGLIGEATEELAVYTGPNIGGLLNATLGNAAELIITVFALREGLVNLVRASITGSIIGNLLLVMGFSMIAGGWKHGTQNFNRRQASLNATMLIIAVLAIAIPSLFDIAIQQNRAAELGFSEGTAVVMIVIYGLSLLYSFRHHHDPLGSPVPEHHKAKWSLRTTIIALVVATVGIAVLSEVLVGAVEPVTHALGLSEFFIGIIIIPLVGNIAEHLVAVQVALKNQMELSLAVSIGSSLQIALFVAPVLVFISLFFQTPLLLVFNSFELIALIAASLVAALIALDGESNWLEGAMLLAVYLIVGLAFYFLPAA
jgi:Ca2+:H+ antiporter